MLSNSIVYFKEKMFADNLDEMDDSREVVQQLIDEYHAARYKLIIILPLLYSFFLYEKIG